MLNLRQALQFSFKDLVGQKKIYSFLVLNFFIGTFGFLLVQFFQSSLKIDLENRAQSMLGADYTVSSNRLFDENQTRLFEEKIRFEDKTSLIEFFAMIQFKDKSRLVSVRAFGDKYPFYGEIADADSKIKFEDRVVWIDPELKTLLDLDSDPNAPLSVGKLAFGTKKSITKDSSRFFRGAGFAPVVYISQKFLAETGLISGGSTLRNYLLYRNSDTAQVRESQTKFYRTVTDTTIRFETAQTRSESSNVIFRYFTDYLGLVSIVAISLCFLSGGYLMQWIFGLQRVNIAIYKTLGMSDANVQAIQVLNVFFVSLISYLASMAFIFLLTPLLNYVFVANGLPFQLVLNLKVVVMSFVIAVAAPIIMFIPTLWSISALSPKDLFQNLVDKKVSNLKTFAWYFLCLTLFFSVAFYQAQSVKIALIFTSSVVGVVIFMRFLLWVLFKVHDRFLARIDIPWKWAYATKSITKRRRSSGLVFVTFACAILILSFLPHVKSSILNEIRPDNVSVVPRLFLFDIQTDQKQSIAETARKHLGVELEFIPLIRSRILKVNETDYGHLDKSESAIRTREDEEEMRFRNRGVNLTYQEHLKPSETIVDGTWNPQPYKGQGLPEISLEKKYAERINAKIGDTMTFDVQGLEIIGRITSLRSVRWTSFNPNFFILFQRGVLEEAPQNYLSSIATNQSYVNFQQELTQKNGNVSVIDVKQTVESVLVFVDQMSLALQLMAMVSMILGFFVFVVLINTQTSERLAEFNLLKVMGLDTLAIKKILSLQFMLLITLSVLTGVGLSFLASYALIKGLFSISVSYDYLTIVILFLTLFPLILFFVRQATRSLDKLSPVDLIRS